MRKLTILLLPVLLASCHHADSKLKKLQDTLAILRKEADFRPMPTDEAYEFINKYYLPVILDSMIHDRKILIYPLVSRDFHAQYNWLKAMLEAKYKNDKTHAREFNFPPDDPLLFNTKYKWDNTKLVNTTLVNDTNLFSTKAHTNGLLWDTLHKRYGLGYMCISYPMYNRFTKLINIRQRLINYDGCGTGKEFNVYYTRTPTGWKMFKAERR